MKIKDGRCEECFKERKVMEFVQALSTYNVYEYYCRECLMGFAEEIRGEEEK